MKGDILALDDYYKTGPYQEVRVIFDGERLVPLNYNNNDLLLPSIFRVIENNIPVNYWDIKLNSCLHNLKISPLIWFDHTIVRQQCLNCSFNVSNDTKSYIFSFTCDDIEYRIITDNSEYFKKQLLNDEPIKFYHRGDLHTLYTNMV